MKRYRWLLWGAFLAIWTVALLRPVPEPAIEAVEQLAPGRRYYVAKAVHVAGYGLLAILSGWLSVPLRFRPLLMFFIMAHCTATELGQFCLTYRDGNLIDVAIDNVAVLLGVGLSWRWWREESRMQQSSE